MSSLTLESQGPRQFAYNLGLGNVDFRRCFIKNLVFVIYFFYYFIYYFIK